MDAIIIYKIISLIAFSTIFIIILLFNSNIFAKKMNSLKY